jgi:hypothetical protein
LFSGGIDSVLLAALLHASLPPAMARDAIDLINVTFEGDDGSGSGGTGGGKSLGPSPDRLAAVAALGELKVLLQQGLLFKMFRYDIHVNSVRLFAKTNVMCVAAAVDVVSLQAMAIGARGRPSCRAAGARATHHATDSGKTDRVVHTFIPFDSAFMKLRRA